MRDIVLSALIGTLLLAVFKHPVLGAYLWAWISLMNPHKLTFGFAFNLPFAQAIAIVTLIVFVGTKKKQPLPMSGIVAIQLLMLLQMTISSLFAWAATDYVIDRWVFVMKTHVMLLVTWMLVTDAKQLRLLIWVVTMSVAFFGIKGGIWTVLTGGGGRVWGPPGGMLADNNALAVGLVMVMPMIHFLRQTEPLRWLRYFLLFAFVTCAFSILGSQSRGALLGLLAMVFFLGLKGKNPVRTSLLLIVAVALAIAFMPSSWTTRMETMNAYTTDGSAMSRLWTWLTLWNAALDRPLVGVGFGADNVTVFARYARLDGEWAVFKGMVYVAHSIYFQMLGEHGFIGLALFLMLGLAGWVKAGRVARQIEGDPVLGSWVPLLMRAVQVSLIGFAVGGAFLSLAYLDLPIFIIGFVVIAGSLVSRRMAERGQDSPAKPAAHDAPRVARTPGLSSR